MKVNVAEWNELRYASDSEYHPQWMFGRCGVT